MKKIFIAIICIANSASSFCQKPALDSAAVVNWPNLGSRLEITRNGRYFLYTINNRPIGSTTLVVQSTDAGWKREFPGTQDAFFSGDARNLVVKTGDTLRFIRLGTDSVLTVPHVASYRKSSADTARWCAYKMKDASNRLVLADLNTGEKRDFPGIAEWIFNNSGTAILMKCESKIEYETLQEIKLINLVPFRSKTIWNSTDTSNGKTLVRNLCVDAGGQQAAFTLQRPAEGGIVSSIWYYRWGMDSAAGKMTDNNTEIRKGLVVSGPLKFSVDGQWLFFRVRRPQATRRAPTYEAVVDVWNYKDVRLQSEQMNSPDPPKMEWEAAIGTGPNTFIQLTNGTEEIVSISSSNDVVIKENRFCSDGHFLDKDSYYVMKLDENSRQFLSNWPAEMSFSQSGRYLAYYDEKRNNYFVYDHLDGKIRNISFRIRTRLDNEFEPPGFLLFDPVGLAGWVGDTAIIVYDNYDIWMLDPTGSRPPYCITNGYGRAHQLKFRLAIKADHLTEDYRKEEPLLLTAFNNISKKNGFYRAFFNKKQDPQLLTIGDFIYCIDERVGSQIPTFSLHSSDRGIRPLKALEANIWVIRRQSSTEAPNYFLTKDFKEYIPLTSMQPQREYNWLTTELIDWKQLDGTLSKGILYKPENFDPRKRYPLIFNYYEELSFDVNAFLTVKFCQDEINIPWFVSRGYLVFVPDIHFSVARISGKVTGECAYNSVVSVAQYLSKKPWIDPAKMGICGWSFAGGETNYLIAHTQMFAAAAEAAGMADEVGSYLSLTGGLGSPMGSRIEGIENGQGRMGVTLWQRPDLYLKNSPILKMDKVTTPLLILHNKGDFAVPWGQGIEVFLALQHLGKKVWLLQYERGQHSVYGQDAWDYTVRLTQFFDHYLRGSFPPKWMTVGIPASEKGTETGYGLDLSGKMP